MPYLPQTTSPFLIPLPTWKTRFLLPCFHFSHILCHRLELEILLLWGVLTHSSSNLVPTGSFISAFQPQATSPSHSGSPGSSSGRVTAHPKRQCGLSDETSCYYQPSLIFLRSRQKNFMFHAPNLSTTLQCPSLVKLCQLFIPHFYQQRLTFFSSPCEAALLQRKAQHWDGFSLCYFLG